MQNYYLRFISLLFTLCLNPILLKSQCSFTTTPPYFEGFEGISVNDQLPTCWAASNLSATCLTYTSSNSLSRIPNSGSKFASFYTSPAGSNSFYTHGIYLFANTTYSASLWYITDITGSANWTDLSILIGSQQNTTNLLPIASTNGSAVAVSYKPLSNSFSVATAGIYYFAVKATSNSTCCATYLSWDDFSITVPCVSVAATPTAVCIGKSATLTASGALTYTWNNGSNSSSIVVTPTANTSFTVTGSNTVIACLDTKTLNLTIASNPTLTIQTSNNPACSNSSVVLNAYGAATYSWSNGILTSSNSIVPNFSTSYSLTGYSANGCEATSSIQLTVQPSPTITAVSSSSYICEGQVVTLSSSGAVTYTWSLPGTILFGSSITVTLNSGTTYAVVGTGTNGCETGLNISLTISDCTGLDTLFKEQTFTPYIFPNPVADVLNLKANKLIDKLIIFDANGRIVFSEQFFDKEIEINLFDLSDGLYYLKIESEKEIVVTKFSKQ